MIQFYVTAIKYGYLTLDDVPAVYLESVKELLDIEDDEE